MLYPKLNAIEQIDHNQLATTDLWMIVLAQVG
jgi:hypothetical protein